MYQDLAATIIGFQEFGIHCREVLAPLRTEMSFVLGERLGDIYVNTIAYDRTRFTARDYDTVWLRRNKTRAATWVVFDDNETDQPFLCINAHLDNKDQKARTDEIVTVLRFIHEQQKTIPIIITADSNISVASPHTRWQKHEMRQPYELLLQAGFIDTWTATHPNVSRPHTYHGFQGEDYDIDEWGTYDTDWILVKGFKPLNGVVVRDNYGGTFPSDHYPILAQLAPILRTE